MRSVDKNRTTLSLAGQDFRLTSLSGEDYMHELEAEVNRRVAAMQKQFPGQSTSRCALLAMLEMADEIKRLSTEYAEVDRKISELRAMRDGSEMKVTPPVKRPFERAASEKRKPVGV